MMAWTSYVNSYQYRILKYIATEALRHPEASDHLNFATTFGGTRF